MAGKRIQSFYLSDDLVDRLQFLKIRAESDVTLLAALRKTAPEPGELRPDARGLLPADYVEMQRLGETDLKGDALLEHVWMRKATPEARIYYTTALKRNHGSTGKPTRVTASYLAELLLSQALDQLDRVAAHRAPPVRKAAEQLSVWARKFPAYRKGSSEVLPNAKKVAKDANVKSRGRKSRNAGQAAQ